MTDLSRLTVLRGTSAYSELRELLGTKASAWAETAHRVHSLERLAVNPEVDRFVRTEAVFLAHRLRDQGRNELLDSPASPLCLRHHKLKVIPHVMQLAERPDCGPVTVATIIPWRTLLSIDELAAITALNLKGRLRSTLIRAGASEARGWLLAGLHGSYDLTSHRIQLHWHLVAAGEMIEVIDRLRQGKAYRSQRSQQDSEVFQRVKVRREPITDLARALSYILQGFWPCRWVGNSKDGSLTRLSHRRRIPEPDHAHWLLWMRGQRLSDLILPMGLTVRDGHLGVR